MKLLFKENSDDVKAYLGFVDADINVLNLLQDIKAATKEVYELIGKELYAKAIEYYEDEISETENEVAYNFLKAVKYPIIVNAYRLYAPSNDLSHTNNGRKMRNEEHEKNAFQWMIEADNASLEKRYYRALEDLIHFLDDLETTEPLHIIWVESEAFKTSHDLFVRTVKEFNEFYNIDSRLLMIKLSPGLYRCEQKEIIARIGAEKFIELKEKLKTSEEITAQADKTLLLLIREACVNYALAWAIPRFSINIFPNAILQNYSSDRMTQNATQTPLKLEADWARQSYLETLKQNLIDIENHVKTKPENLNDININPLITYGTSFFSC